MSSDLAADLVALDVDGVEEFSKQLTQRDQKAAVLLVQSLERNLDADRLARIERVWGLSGAEVGSILGVGREAYRKWRTRLPPAREPDVAQLDRATDLLLSKVRVDRIPAIVRTPAPLLEGQSLLAIAMEDGPSAVADAADWLFDIRRVQP